MGNFKQGTQSTRAKDWIISLLIVLALGFLGWKHFTESSQDGFGMRMVGFVGILTYILWGAVGVFEFGASSGMLFVTPSYYLKCKENLSRKHVNQAIEEVVNKESEFLLRYDQRRISMFLQQLGLNRSEFDLLKMEMLKIKMLPMRKLEDAQKKMESIIYQKSVIWSQKNTPSTELVYKQVDYFINFTDIMYIDDFAKEITDCMAMLIQDALGDRLGTVNKLIVPHSSNLILGAEMSKKLGISLAHMTKEPKVFQGVHYEGDFSKKSKYQTIVIHDVLVTGSQVIESIKKLPEQCYNPIGIFCLVNRLDCDGKKKLENMNYKVYSLLELTDEDIENELNKREEAAS